MFLPLRGDFFSSWILEELGENAEFASGKRQSSSSVMMPIKVTYRAGVLVLSICAVKSQYECQADSD